MFIKTYLSVTENYPPSQKGHMTLIKLKINLRLTPYPKIIEKSCFLMISEEIEPN